MGPLHIHALQSNISPAAKKIHMTPFRNESSVFCLQSSHMMQCSFATWLVACRLTPHDSARYWGRFEPDTYDCVLLDAPCTSERHVLQQAASGSDKSAKLRWSVRQCEDMAALQVRLLTAALKVSNFLMAVVLILSVPVPVCLYVPNCRNVSCYDLMPHTSCLMPHTSCLTSHASHLMSHTSDPYLHTLLRLPSFYKSICYCDVLKLLILRACATDRLMVCCYMRICRFGVVNAACQDDV